MTRNTTQWDFDSLFSREIASEWAFRLPFVLQMIPALVVGLGIHFFPFSPRWLAMRQRNDEALGSVAKLRRLPGSDQRVQLEYKGIIAEVRVQEEIQRQEHPHSSALRLEAHSWLDLFKPRYLKRTLISIAIPFFQQFSGKLSIVQRPPFLVLFNMYSTVTVY